MEKQSAKKIIIADNSGFCYGVKHALNLATKSLERHSKVCSLGPLIHSPQEVKRLEDLGLHVIDATGKVNGYKALIIPAHGIPVSEFNEATKLKLEIIDATCPFVRKVVMYAQSLEKEGYTVFIIGDKEHPEVKCIMGSCLKKPYLISGPDDAKKLVKDVKIQNRVGVVAQTTQTIENFKQIIEIIIDRFTEIKIHNTICDATEKRQKSTLELSRKVDMMIIVGGRNSANTSRLVRICKNAGQSNVKHIEVENELNRKWFHGMKVIAISAGASTPGWIINNVYNNCKKIMGI